MEKTRKEFDVRVVQFHLRNGDVGYDAFQKHLDDLPDDAEEAVESSARFDNAYERRANAEAQGDA